MEYCSTRQIPVDHKQSSGSPYSMDANLLHISYEGGVLEDPSSIPVRICGVGRFSREST